MSSSFYPFLSAFNDRWLVALLCSLHGVTLFFFKLWKKVFHARQRRPSPMSRQKRDSARCLLGTNKNDMTIQLAAMSRFTKKHFPFVKVQVKRYITFFFFFIIFCCSNNLAHVIASSNWVKREEETRATSVCVCCVPFTAVTPIAIYVHTFN